MLAINEINDSGKNFSKQTESRDTMKDIKYVQKKPTATGGLTQTELAYSIHQFNQNGDKSHQQISGTLLPNPKKFE